jgi:hypothetical protein
MMRHPRRHRYVRLELQSVEPFEDGPLQLHYCVGTSTLDDVERYSNPREKTHRRPTNRWTVAAGACFVTCLVGEGCEIAPPRSTLTLGGYLER